MGITRSVYNYKDTEGADLGPRADRTKDINSILAMYNYLHGIGFTYRDDVGNLLALGGFNFIDKHMGEPWAILTPLFYKHRFSLHRIMKRDWNCYLNALKDFTMVVDIDETDMQAVRWAKAIGFTFKEDC